MKLKNLIVITFVFVAFVSTKMTAQELKCQVNVSSAKVDATDKSAFEALQQAIYEFMNQTKWTNATFEDQEKIECSILITIDNWDRQDKFEGQIHVQSRRPVYNTSLNTTLFNFKDKSLNFKYLETEPLNFQENSFTDNLTSVLAYYAYVIIGLDFDSFQLNGGRPFFEKAQSIVNSAQGSGETGWQAYESRKNRFWIVENLLNAKYQGIHNAMYNYHRLGLDVMFDSRSKGTGSIIKSLEELRKAFNESRDLFFLTLFMQVKQQELVNMFKKASESDKARAIPLLKELDPANSNKYDAIRSN